MKTNLTFLVITMAALSVCASPQTLKAQVYTDDIYYSSKDAAADKEKRQQLAEQEKQRQLAEQEKRKEEAAKRAADEASGNQNKSNQSSESSNPDDYYSTTERSTDANGNTTVTNNYYDRPFDYNDYYDDEYSVRLRRFHNNVGNYGYYDNYYTNSYWYTGNPYNYGTSVYMGYNFWGPSYTAFAYNPGFFWSSNLGWGGGWDNGWGGNGWGGGWCGLNPASR